MLPGHGNTIQGRNLQSGSWPWVWPQVQTSRSQHWGERTKMAKAARLKHPLNLEASRVPLKAQVPEEGVSRYSIAS